MNYYTFVICGSLLGVLSCENKLKIKTMNNSESESAVIYKAGTPVTVEESDDEVHPLFLGDASAICSDLTFYNANGELVQGTRNCTTSSTDPNLKPEYIKEGVIIGGVTGTAPVLADVSEIRSENIRSGVTIAGITGSVLPRPASCSADGELSCVSTASFPAASAAGLATKIMDGETVAGVNGTAAPDCTGDGQTDCKTTTRYKSVDTSVLAAWDIRKGKSAGGIAGSLTFYKNMADTITPVFDRTAGTGGVSGLDIYDTIDDYRNNGGFPTQSPGGWDQATGANWTQELANTSYKDQVTGLVWLVDQGSFTWENAITQCADATAGSRIDWRLPTQKELMQAYANGIWSQQSNLSLSTVVSTYYWSATTRSDATTFAWLMSMHYGITNISSKGNSNRVVCVAP